jgi:chromosome segregation ATPase
MTNEPTTADSIAKTTSAAKAGIDKLDTLARDLLDEIEALQVSLEAAEATIKELEEKLLASKAIYLSVTCAEDLAEFDKLNAQIKKQETTLKAVAELPDGWQNIDSRFDTGYKHAKRGCADELKAVLEKHDEK